MERTSDKHGARIDGMLDSETASLTHGAPVDSRAEEYRAEEPVAESGIVGADASSARPLETPVGALSHEEVNERSELARHLSPATFPADRAELVRVAEEEFAPDEMLERLRRLPAHTGFENFQAVWAAMGGAVEQRADSSAQARRAQRDEETVPGTPALVKAAGAVAHVGIVGMGVGIGVVRALVKAGRSVVDAARRA
jgi:hypothetical protein